MIVVSDTTVLHYLAALGELEVLPRLFGSVVCPPEVLAECRHPHAPHRLQQWAASIPPWLAIQDAPPMDVDAWGLDAGEAAAIRLALHLNAGLILMDERKGRRLATTFGLTVAGVLSVLAEGATHGWLDFDSAVRLLRETTNFRISEVVIAQVRARLTDSRQRGL